MYDDYEEYEALKDALEALSRTLSEELEQKESQK